MSIIEKFVSQIDTAIQKDKNIKPAFSVKRSKQGDWVPVFKDLKFKKLPMVYYPTPKLEHFLSHDFQEKLNKYLKENPITLKGKINLKFKIKDQLHKIPDVTWVVQVYGLKKIDMNLKGSVTLTLDYRGL